MKLISFKDTYSSRNDVIINPSTYGSYSKLTEIISNWKSQDYLIGCVTGVYDLFHPCHQWYLRNVKFEMIKKHLNLDGITMDDFQNNYQKIKLIVVVDGNSINRRKKSRNSENGESVRPIHDWSQRARNVAEMVWTPLENSKPEFVVDLVTGHDDEEFAGTIFENYSKLILSLKPEFWAIHCSSVKTFEKATGQKISDKVANTSIIVIPDIDYEINPIDKKPYSTTNIVKLIRG